MAWLNTETVCPRTVTHLGTNPARCRVTLLMCPVTVPLNHHQGQGLTSCYNNNSRGRSDLGVNTGKISSSRSGPYHRLVGSKTPKGIATKRRVLNCVVEPTPNSKHGSDWAAWVVSAHAWNITVCDFLLFLFFSSVHLAYRSPQWTNFTIYTSNDTFLHKELPFRGLDDEFLYLPSFLPKICIMAYGIFEQLQLPWWRQQLLSKRQHNIKLRSYYVNF